MRTSLFEPVSPNALTDSPILVTANYLRLDDSLNLEDKLFFLSQEVSLQNVFNFRAFEYKNLYINL